MKIEIGTRVLDNQGHSGIVERIAKSPEVLQKYPNGLYYVSHSVDDYGYKTNTDGWYLPEKLIPLYKCLTAKQVSKINKAYINGDAVALDEISLALQENHFEEDSTEMKLLDFCYHLNYLLIETETNSYASDYNCEILDYGDEIDVNYYNSDELYEMVEDDIGNNDAKELVNVGIDELNESYEDMEL